MQLAAANLRIQQNNSCGLLVEVEVGLSSPRLVSKSWVKKPDVVVTIY